MPRRFWMLGEAVESCQPWRPCSTRPTLPSAKSARSQRDGAALWVLRRCAGEESPPGLSVASGPCTTPNGAPTYVIVFTSSSTKFQVSQAPGALRLAGSNRDETSPCGLLDESHLTGQQNSLDTNVIARKPAPKAKFQVRKGIAGQLKIELDHSLSR